MKTGNYISLVSRGNRGRHIPRRKVPKDEGRVKNPKIVYELVKVEALTLWKNGKKLGQVSIEAADRLVREGNARVISRGNLELCSVSRSNPSVM